MNRFFRYFTVKRNILKVLIVLLSILMILVLGVVTYTPFYNLKKFNSLYSDSLKYSVVEKLALKNHEYFELKKHEAYLKSRLLAAKSDSITLSINIPDSIISIEVQGFILHQVKFKKAKVDFLLSKANKESLITFIETPLTINTDFATIKKEPVVYKKAPKDTIEAAKQISVPDTVDYKKVMVKFYLDRDLIIEMKQSEKKPHKGQLIYNIKEESEKLKLLFKDLFKLKIPEYHPRIQIELDKNDIKSFYRALPNHALVTIKI